MRLRHGSNGKLKHTPLPREPMLLPLAQAPITLNSTDDLPVATLLPNASAVTVWQDFADLEAMAGIVPIARRIAPAVDSLTADALGACDPDNRTFSMGLQTAFYTSFRG